MFVKLILFFLGFGIFLLSAPILFEIISVTTPGLGTATGFVVSSYMWVVLIVLIGTLYALMSSGEGFFG